MTTNAISLIFIVCLVAIVTGVLTGRRGDSYAIKISGFAVIFIMILSACAVYFANPFRRSIFDREMSIVALGMVTLFTFLWIIVTIPIIMKSKNGIEGLKKNWKILVVYIMMAFGTPAAHYLVSNNIYTILDWAPYVDVVDDRNTDLDDYVKATCKGFGVQRIDSMTIMGSDVVIRIYDMPSFNTESLMEIKQISGIKQLSMYRVMGSSIWSDRQIKTDYGGRVATSGEYKPKLVTEVKNEIETELAIEVFQKLSAFNLVEMKSTTRMNILTKQKSEILDANSYIVEYKSAARYNVFEFVDQEYDDTRLVWIKENFNAIKNKMWANKRWR